jgi:hypothetical protein
MPRLPGANDRFTREQLEEDAVRIGVFLERVHGVLTRMKNTGIQSIRVAKSPSYSRCLDGIKAWAASIDDGLDEEVSAQRKAPTKGR